MTIEHPMQPLYKDEHGVVRFKSNLIIDYLFRAGILDLNRIGIMSFPQEDQEQLAQLLGYSVSGFGDLSYVRDETYEKAALLVEDFL